MKLNNIMYTLNNTRCIKENILLITQIIKQWLFNPPKRIYVIVLIDIDSNKDKTEHCYLDIS